VLEPNGKVPPKSKTWAMLLVVFPFVCFRVVPL